LHGTCRLNGQRCMRYLLNIVVPGKPEILISVVEEVVVSEYIVIILGSGILVRLNSLMSHDG
jgi:hypothetical protein